MIFSSASSNPAGTVLTVRGRAKSRTAPNWNRHEDRADFVVSGDAHKIVRSLKERSVTGWRFFFGMTFRARDLPQPYRELNIVSVDDEYAAEVLTRAERDFFLYSGFDYAEIFEHIVARRTLASETTERSELAPGLRTVAPLEEPFCGERFAQ